MVPYFLLGYLLLSAKDNLTMEFKFKHFLAGLKESKFRHDTIVRCKEDKNLNYKKLTVIASQLIYYTTALRDIGIFLTRNVIYNFDNFFLEKKIFNAWEDDLKIQIRAKISGKLR